MTRTETIRLALGCSQPEMAQHLGVTQPTISRLEAGKDEPGPIVRLLNLLAERVGRADLVVEVSKWPPFTTQDGTIIPHLVDPLPADRTSPAG